MKNLKKGLILLLLLPTMVFVGCSKKSNIKSINLSYYLASESSYTEFGSTSTQKMSTSNLYANHPISGSQGKYISIETSATADAFYKMYIDTIYFYVYTSHEAQSEMIVNVSISNLVDEADINTSKEDDEKIFTAQCSFMPKENNSTLCEVKVNKTVATALGSTLTFDIKNTTYGIVCTEDGEANDFKWCIFGLQINGESRAYSQT